MNVKSILSLATLGAGAGIFAGPGGAVIGGLAGAIVGAFTKEAAPKLGGELPLAQETTASGGVGGSNGGGGGGGGGGGYATGGLDGSSFVGSSGPCVGCGGMNDLATNARGAADGPAAPRANYRNDGKRSASDILRNRPVNPPYNTNGSQGVQVIGESLRAIPVFSKPVPSRISPNANEVAPFNTPERIYGPLTKRPPAPPRGMPPDIDPIINRTANNRAAGMVIGNSNSGAAVSRAAAQANAAWAMQQGVNGPGASNLRPATHFDGNPAIRSIQASQANLPADVFNNIRAQSASNMSPMRSVPAGTHQNSKFALTETSGSSFRR